MSTEATQTYILKLSCPDRVGIVAAVSGFLAEHGGWILEAQHHSDQTTGMYYMRQVIRADSLNIELDAFRTAFAAIAERFEMQWSVTDTSLHKRVVILVSKMDHCLIDLLYRWRTGEYDVEIPAVISNHPDSYQLVASYGIPFHHIPMTKDNKAEAFEEIEKLFLKYAGDVMVLARFMQIIPDWLCERHAGKIINIHHSFLPSFIGAKPYHQAFERGVKLIGATCHYVTGDLDEGPIIEQDVARVGHEQTADDMVRLGRDVEKLALARGLRFHLEDRVFIHKNKTIVL